MQQRPTPDLEPGAKYVVYAGSGAAVEPGNAQDIGGQLDGVKAGLRTPGPVAAGQCAGTIHPALFPQLQVVLHLHHAEPGHAGLGCPDHTPDVALLLVQSQIGFGDGHILRKRLIKPLPS